MYVVNMQTSKNMQSIFGTTVPAGSAEWFVHFSFVVRGYSHKTDEIINKCNKNTNFLENVLVLWSLCYEALNLIMKPRRK